jgi:cold shock CspA family protein
LVCAIIRFNAGRGYGFIERHDRAGRDVFAHEPEARRGGIAELREGCGSNSISTLIGRAADGNRPALA